MPKLVEREVAPRVSPLSAAPALAVQFFLIPLAVVGVIVLVYGGFRMLLTTERTPAELLSDVRTGGRERRWPAAYELSRMLSDPRTEAQNPRLGAAIVQAFVDSEGDDPRVRRYLALAIGRLATPPREAVDELTAALGDSDTETRISVIWALGFARQTNRRWTTSKRCTARTTRVSARWRCTRSGPWSGRETTPRCATRSTIRPADVQWNAAVALARHGRSDGMNVIRRMLDREYVTRMVTRRAGTDDPLDPVSEVIVSGLQAAASLQAAELRQPIEALSETDQNLRVRELAMKTLDVLNQSTRLTR